MAHMEFGARGVSGLTPELRVLLHTLVLFALHMLCRGVMVVLLATLCHRFG